jgi:hypothetical protein
MLCTTAVRRVGQAVTPVCDDYEGKTVPFTACQQTAVELSGGNDMTDTPKTIALEFAGVFMKSSGLPASSGVYCVYTCVDKDEKTVTIKKLVYIGESGDVRARVANHNLLESWKKHLASGEVLCFTAATVSPESTRQRAEAAMIFQHKPPVNDEYTHAFPFDTTTINVSGKTTKLTTTFTVKKDSKD